MYNNFIGIQHIIHSNSIACLPADVFLEGGNSTASLTIWQSSIFNEVCGSTDTPEEFMAELCKYVCLKIEVQESFPVPYVMEFVKNTLFNQNCIKVYKNRISSASVWSKK